MTEGKRLAQFSELVRSSSLKRFKQVAPQDREWRPAANQLSFVDILKHLCDSDRWIISILKGDQEILGPSVKPGDGKAKDWEWLLQDLEELGVIKADYLRLMNDVELFQEGIDWEELGLTGKWLILMRGNLDHEIQHRGALQMMLNLKYK